MRPHYHIAIIGGGFAGCQLVRRLVEGADRPLSIALIDRGPFLATGAAYATARPEHLLNVRAGVMGAAPEQVDGFHRWLTSEAAAESLGQAGLITPPPASDFLPRRLYGDYLRQRWSETQYLAEAGGIRLDIIAQEAVSIAEAPEGLRVDFAQGESLLSNRLVLALGNHFAAAKPSSRVIHQPWQFDFERGSEGARGRGGEGETGVPSASSQPASKSEIRDPKSEIPVVILGTGLTAVDTLLSLERAGWRQPVVAISRRGLFPRPHAAPAPPWKLSLEAFGEAPRLSGVLRHLRREVRAAAAEGVAWQAVMDGLRPHTVALWRRLPTVDQRRLLRRYESLWNVHRHRMPAEVAARIKAMQASGQLRVLAASCDGITKTADGVRIALGGDTLYASLVFDCRGPGRALPSRPPLRSLLESGLALPHPSSVGVATDGAYQLSGAPAIFAMGNLLVGERLESTAVPELRQQAAELAELLLKSL